MKKNYLIKLIIATNINPVNFLHFYCLINLKSKRINQFDLFKMPNDSLASWLGMNLAIALA